MSQSFLRGVIRWGGIGIRLVSDLSVVFSAPADTGENTNAEEVDGSRGSVSIISSSSASSSTAAVIVVGSASTSKDEETAPRVMSISSFSLSTCWDEEGWVWVGFLRVILLRFFLAFTPDNDVVEVNNLGVTTMFFFVREVKISRCHITLCHTLYLPNEL